MIEEYIKEKYQNQRKDLYHGIKTNHGMKKQNKKLNKV